jgi:hypothetical protein
MKTLHMRVVGTSSGGTIRRESMSPVTSFHRDFLLYHAGHGSKAEPLVLFRLGCHMPVWRGVLYDQVLVRDGQGVNNRVSERS